MQEISKVVTVEESGQAEVNRRTLLGRVAAAGLGLAVLRLMPSAQAATQPKQPEAETGKDYPQPRPSARTEAQFRKGVMPIANISLLTSQIAVDKASDPAALEFANFELREAIGVSKVLKEMNTPTPPLSARDRALLQKLRNTPRGAAFDAAYITAQLGAHEFLRDLAESYLGNSMSMNMKEMHGRHLAIINLATFKEHIVHCKNIKRSMMA